MSLPPILPPDHRPSLRIRLWHLLRRLMPPLTKEERGKVRAQLRDSSAPDFDFFLLVALSSVIATFGLITDSVAVIIGAMLVAPLMSPILGLSLATIGGDEILLRDAVSAVARGMLFSIGVAWLLTWSAQVLPFNPIIPNTELPLQIMMRTHPSPFDLGIAIAGGLAAAFALAQPGLSAALPGVAIATALMPPLCTVGIGLALRDWPAAAGAMLLFLTNLAAIAFAGLLIFFILGFRPRGEALMGQRLPRSLMVSAALVAILVVPLGYVSASFVRQGAEDLRIQQTVARAAASYRAELITLGVERMEDSLHLEITLRSDRAFRYEQVRSLQEELVTLLQRPLSIAVSVIPSARLDPLIPPTLTSTWTPGPTPTSTYTPTPSITPRPSATVTATSSATPTMTPTPTPARLVLDAATAPGLVLRDAPFGEVITQLWFNTEVVLLPGRVIDGGLVWIKVMDPRGQIGWIPESFTRVITLTPTVTSTRAPTSTAGPAGEG
jgi:uncharacterized hydrophobic protein (TIGR00271 family)